MRFVKDKFLDELHRDAFNEGVEAVTAIRCIPHREIMVLNRYENPDGTEGECCICQIERLLAIGAPGHHVLRLVGSGEISAGKGCELLISVLLGEIGRGDLPSIDIGEPQIPA